MNKGRSLRLLAVAALATAPLLGCGADPAPTASATAAEPAAKPVKTIRITDATVAAALEPADTYVSYIGERGVRSVTATIGPEGGELIVDETGGRPQDNLRITFTVPPGALSEFKEITMLVSGDVLSEMTIGFDPCGTQFTPWAQLYYHLGIERVDLDLETLWAVHLHDGVEDEIDTDINHTGNSKSVQVWLDVPGFSLYGLRD